MKKKGFTLIEVLATVVILGILVLLTIPIISSNIQKTKTRAYESQVKAINSAARKYMTRNTHLLPDENNPESIIQLVSIAVAGLIEDNIENPLTGGTMNGCVKVSYNKNNEVYFYEYSDDCSFTPIATP